MFSFTSICGDRSLLGAGLSVAVAVAAVAGFSAASHAATYYLQANTGNTDWTTNTIAWWDQSSGGGNHPASAAALAGQVFDVNGFVLTSANYSSTFPGDSLLLNGGGLTFRGGAGITQTVISGTATGTTTLTPGGDQGTLRVNSYSNAGTTILEVVPNAGTPSANFNFGTLTGSGDFLLKTNSSYSLGKITRLTVENAAGWTGTIGGWTNLAGTTSKQMSLAFGNDTIFGGSLIVPSQGRITLDHNVTFAAVTFDGISLTPGIYSFDYLNTHFDAIFDNGGSGSITVAPEPATLALLGIAGLLLTLNRNARA